MFYLKYIIFISHKYTYEVFSSELSVLPPRDKDPNKNPSVGMRNNSSQLLVSVVQETPKTYSLFLFYCPWLPPEEEGEFLLLNTPSTLDMGPDTGQELTGKPSL